MNNGHESLTIQKLEYIRYIFEEVLKKRNSRYLIKINH